MKKYLFILLLLPVTALAQFPKKIVIQKDTLILITPIQLKHANLIFLQRDYFRKLSLNYDSTIRLYKHRETNWQHINAEHIQTENLLRTQLNALTEQKDVQKKHYSHLIKKEYRKKVRSIVVAGLIGVAIGVVIGVH